MVGHDATGTWPPLRPAIEPHIRDRLSLINEMLRTQNADVLAPGIADAFLLTTRHGEQHDQFDADLITRELAAIGAPQLEVVFLNDDVARIYYLVGRDDPKPRRIRLDVVPPQWKISHIDFQHEENPLPVEAPMKVAATWARVKMAEKVGYR